MHIRSRVSCTPIPKMLLRADYQSRVYNTLCQCHRTSETTVCNASEVRWHLTRGNPRFADREPMNPLYKPWLEGVQVTLLCAIYSGFRGSLAQTPRCLKTNGGPLLKHLTWRVYGPKPPSTHLPLILCNFPRWTLWVWAPLAPNVSPHHHSSPSGAGTGAERDPFRVLHLPSHDHLLGEPSMHDVQI